MALGRCSDRLRQRLDCRPAETRRKNSSGNGITSKTGSYFKDGVTSNTSYFSIDISCSGYDPCLRSHGDEKLQRTWILGTGTVLVALNLGACGGGSSGTA